MSAGGHIPPERWADWARGRLPDEERATFDRHAEGCTSCRAARDRVAAARRTLDEIAAAPPPALSWDLLGARVSWTISSEIKRRERSLERRARWLDPRRLAPALLASVAIAASAVIAVQASRRAESHHDLALAPVPTEAAPVVEGPAVPETGALSAAAPPRALEGMATLIQGDVVLGDRPLELDARIEPGQTISTRRGRVAIQLGDRSGFILEEESSVRVTRFDDSEIELSVTGAISVEVTARRPDQRFAVMAGERSVEVRGTAFRVASRDGALDVAVSHGRVAVLEGTDAVEIPAGAELLVPAGVPLLGSGPRILADDEAARLRAQTDVPVLPWLGGVEATRRGTSELRVAARGRSRVRVDGVETGMGALLLRTPPGRHLVEVGGVSRWVEIDAGARADASLDQGTNHSERPRQVDGELERNGRLLSSCGERARKYDPAFEGQMVLEIGIHGDGSVGFVSALQGLSDRDVEACILEAVRSSFTFPPGSAGTVRKKIHF